MSWTSTRPGPSYITARFPGIVASVQTWELATVRHPASLRAAAPSPSVFTPARPKKPSIDSDTDIDDILRTAAAAVVDSVHPVRHTGVGRSRSGEEGQPSCSTQS